MSFISLSIDIIRVVLQPQHNNYTRSHSSSESTW